ncbi:DUF4142 domain-containing protein [Streptomyces spongiae]|uniref:DUF4142 domain-containing protein n=1 Tax=Streptomyces spongiae TaxID=565072 RepID=A0A5N8XS43_9ACTN|nr:DUF4142 domain-containing protein [Streptomyces spongiae]MPY62217.1 DUF4142 domain-containing protein [Streptomyces spongiae]
MERIKGSVIAGVALIVTVGALSFPVWSYSDRSGTAQANMSAGMVDTQWGPLAASDRDLIERVRLAGLWELPAAEMAMKKSSSKAVKEAADHLITGHTDLDQRVRTVATKMGIELPDEPNAQQKGWLQQMQAAQGEEFDRTWANLLRSAHGKIFPAIGTVRNNTQNMMVRQLASDTNQTVLDHITMLEKTGEVDFDAIANGTI